MTKATYEIRVTGSVPDDVLENFAGVVTGTDVVGTTMRVEVADAAAVNGLLSALRHAGIELQEVRRERFVPAQEQESSRRGSLER